MRMRFDREQKNQCMRTCTGNRTGSGRIWLLGLLAALLLFLMCTGRVYAADGTLSIAVSSANVPAGSEVEVTLTASGSGGERATADMEFTYNSSVFSFVSCNAEGYGGGDGGKVTFRGSSVTVKLKATGQGSSNLKVTGSNGVIRDSGAALDNMVAAGATITAGGAAENAKSGDNSLSSLSLSAGELSPAFVYSTTSYTAAVPYETTSVEVNAKASNGKAEITSIEGGGELQVGENTIKVTVKAENGAVAVYTIIVTRAAAPEAPAEGENPQNTPEGTEGAGVEGTGSEGAGTEGITPQEPEADNAALIEDYESRLEYANKQYNQLDEKYKTEKSSHRKWLAILIFIIAVLVIVCANLVIYARGRSRDGEEEEPETETRKEKAPAKTRQRRTEHRAEKKKSPRRFSRKEKEDWLDDDDEDDMENAIFSRTAIPAPKKDADSQGKSMDFIDLDDL